MRIILLSLFSFMMFVPVVQAQPLNLMNTELRGQVFSNRDLSNSEFMNVQIRDTSFEGVNFANTSFFNVNFHNVSFKNARFNDVELSNVEFHGGDLRGAVFAGADLMNISFMDGVKLYGADFTNAELFNVSYDGADYSAGDVVQASKITQQLTQAPAKSQYHEKAHINLAILFEFDSDKLQHAAWGQLEELSKALSHPDLQTNTFLVEGHTDSMGQDEYNRDLSYRRAFSVRRALIEQLGINSDRLTVKGYGESRPVADNDSEYGRSLNRRVTIVNLGTR